VNLRHIHQGLLIMFAGGDPWNINASLQKGQPGQISDFAEGFRDAGRSTQAADNAFTDARNRLNAWTRDNGQHPVTDSNKVQQLTKALGLQAAQLPKIAVDLENVAAALAQAQTTAAGDIATLEARLQYLDDWIGWAENRIQQDEAAIAETDDEDEIAELRDDQASCQDGITACEKEAVDDTKTTVQHLTQVRQDYSKALQGAETNLRAEGFNPAAIQALDADASEDQLPGQVPRTGLESGQLNDLQRATDQAVIDQMAKVRAAQQAVNAAARDVVVNGPGSAKADAAAESMPQLRKNLADALDDLGKIPNYTNIDPATMSTDENGRFLFSYNADGQNAQVTGQFKNGTGQFFDQGTGTSYTFKDGKLAGMQTPDPGQVSATVEPLWSAVTLAVGGPELKAAGEAGLQALKAGGGRAWPGLSSLFGRENAAGLGDLNSENVLPRAVAAAEQRTTDAQHYLMTHPPGAAPAASGAADAGAAGAGGAGVGVGEHPGAPGAGSSGGPGGGPVGGGGHPGGGHGVGAEEPVPGGATAPAAGTGGGQGAPGGGAAGRLGSGGHPEPAPLGAPGAGATDGHCAPLPGGAGAGDEGGGAAGGGGVGDGNAGYGGAGDGDHSGTPLEAGQPPIQSDDLPPPPAPPDSPLFDGYQATDPGPEFTDSDGQLIYPDESLDTKPYAIPGTDIPDANLPKGTMLGRFGYPGGAYLTPEGTPFAQLSLPPSSAVKPYYQYVVEDPARLPPDWHIEESKVAPWFHQPGGGIQFRVIDEFGAGGSVEELIRWGFLRRVN
jgi:hypothetical protein